MHRHQSHRRPSTHSGRLARPVPGETEPIGPEIYLEQKKDEKQVQRLTNVAKPTIKVFRAAPDRIRHSGIDTVPVVTIASSRGTWRARRWRYSG